MQRNERAPTLLTGANRSAGRDSVRRRAKVDYVEPVVSLPSACLECGVLLDNPKRAYCDDCLPDHLDGTIVAFSTAGPEALANLRAKGKDPAHGGEAAEKRGRTNQCRACSGQSGVEMQAGPGRRGCGFPARHRAWTAQSALEPDRKSHRPVSPLLLADPTGVKGASPTALAGASHLR